MNKYTYQIGESLYINVTNECPNRCSFCVRESTDGFGEESLWLAKEPSPEDIINSIDNNKVYKEFVFCGFGEPLAKLEVVLETAKQLKKYNLPIRVNTNGLANLIQGYNVPPKLEGLIDIVSISLNADNKEKYQELCQSLYGEKAYHAMLDFAKECKKYVPRVILSVVKSPEVDVEKCREIASDLGVEFRVREWSPTL